MANSNVKFLSGSFSQYSALAVKDANTLYFLDNGQLFKGEVSYSDQIVVVSALPSPLVAGKVYVNTTDKSVTYYDGTTPTVVVPATVGSIGDSTPDTDLANVKAIKDFVATEIAKIPAAKDYTVTLVDDATADGELTKQTIKQGEVGSETDVGTIVVPDLKMEVKATPNDGYLKTYQFTYGDRETFEINIPKDLVVTSGTVIVVDDDNPVSGLEKGTYLRLTIANQDKPVYIDVKDLGENGITPHIDSVTKHWFIGETDTGILAEGVDGNDGITPNIGANGNWFIGDTDTGVTAQGKDGKSIKSITKDDNNNVIVTFTDNTTQNIGKLTVDIQGDFLTDGGFGNLRYYNSHFQYYDAAASTWVDTSITPDNVYVMNMMPQPMKKIMGVYDTEIGKYKLKWEEPDDTIIDGQVACVVEKVIIRRKLGSVPINEADGDLVVEIKRNDFGQYKNYFYVDNTLSPNNNDVYYYKAFPMSTTGFYNTSTVNETIGIKCKDYNLYGFKLDQNESDPASMITYLSDCDNAQFDSAYMNYSTDTFNYGDWGDVWFIKKLKPCMLKYDGTVDYELDKNDYTKKADGTDSDVANTSYGGNAMIGFPKVYWKIIDNGDNTANIYICDKTLDNDFHCWSHIDNNGNEIDYCYMPIYTGSLVGSTLRSLSDLAPMVSKTRQAEINYAKANNTGSDIIWYTEVFSDRKLLELLLLLIGKSTDTQTVFGAGNNNSFVSASNTGVKKSGTMNNKGLFWGSNDNVSGVKAFGMEHIWGNTWRAVAGWINDKGTQKIKMTYGQSDGSTTDGYNIDGTGYISVVNSTPSGNSPGYISKLKFDVNGLIPIIASGSATTYYCDSLTFNNNQNNYCLVAGSSGTTTGRAGIFTQHLSFTSSTVAWAYAASISCKPLALTT